MDLGGTWLACEADDARRRSFPDPATDDADWLPVPVPGHWRNVAAFAASDGPLLYRRRFETPPGSDPGPEATSDAGLGPRATSDARPGPETTSGAGPDGEAASRAWLTFDGLFYQGDVWLDGSYLGDTEGYFAPQTFEVTSHMAERGEHLVAVEVACNREADLAAKRNLTGIFQHWDCIAEDWNPGGIWAPVRIWTTGPVRIATLRVTCPEASAERATLELEATLDATDAVSAVLDTTVTPLAAAAGAKPGPAGPGGHQQGPAGPGGHQQGPAGPGGHQQGPAGPGGHQQGPVAHHSSEQALAAGSNRVRWRVAVERPMLWWPRALGAQPRHRVEVAVALDGVPSDVRAVDTGLRQVRMRNFIASVNGERIFLKGSNLAPTNRALADATAAQVEGDVHLAIDAGLDLLRVHAHIARPELYEAADREGMLLWQDLPLQWSYKGVRRQAIRQARQAVDLLAHHPSVAIWCGHNEPFSAGVEPGGDVTASAKTRLAAGQILPSWNKTRLDHSIKRSLEKADGSRPVVAHSGVIPHPGGGTDSHFYFGWYHGDERDLPRALARLPTMARWVGEFGAQAVPDSDDFMGPQRWPDLDWDHLGRAHALQKGIFDRRVPPAAHETLGEWRHATQSYQAELIRFHVETLRRLKYHPTGGFCHFLLADAQPAVSWSVLDHLRVPKTGYRALADACAPVIVVADRPAASYRPGERLDIAVHVVSDLRVALGDAVVTAVLRWADGQRTWRFAGDVGADSCSRVGRLEHTWPGDVADGAVDVDLHLDVPERATIASNHYCSEISDTDGTVA